MAPVERYAVQIDSHEDLQLLYAMIEEHNTMEDLYRDVYGGHSKDFIRWDLPRLHEGVLFACLSSSNEYGVSEYGVSAECMKACMNAEGFKLDIYWPWQLPEWWGDTPAISREELATTDEISPLIRKYLSNILDEQKKDHIMHDGGYCRWRAM
jgi:hypothetical protein